MESEDQSSDSHHNEQKSTFSTVWTNTLISIRKPILRVLLIVSGRAARNPKTCVISTILFSITVLAIGIFTNFNVDVNQDTLWTPTPSRVLSHGKWIKEDSAFPDPPNWFELTVHADSKNILGNEGIKRVFTAIDTVRNLPNYDKICDQASLSMTKLDGNNTKLTCYISSPTRFWNFDVNGYNKDMENEKDTIQRLSMMDYPDRTPVDLKSIFGINERGSEDDDNILTSVQLYVVRIALPPLDEVDEVAEFEKIATEKILDLRNQWIAESGNIFRLEVFSNRSFDDEFNRAIVNDIPLVPIVFVVMSIFTCLIFFRPNWVYSRSLLGLGAVVSVLLSIMAGYGFLFIVGVPFTSMTQILPFIMFGIGLDDAFILSGAYKRTDKSKDVINRIEDTVEEVGISIFVTTVSSMSAFSLGCISSVPAVYWLCQYAIPTLFLDFFFQITFFIALIVIDERRVIDKRRDCLVCIRADTSKNENEEEAKDSLGKYMLRFANFLMKTWVKVLVILVFLGFFGGMAYSASKLEQIFDFEDVLPSGSYVAAFWKSQTNYRGGLFSVRPEIFFRGVDQSDELTQNQMQEYVNELVNMKQVTNKPLFFWLRDFKKFVASNGTDSIMFAEQLDDFLADSTYSQMYKNDIVRAEDGSIITSRTRLFMDQVTADVKSQIDAIEDQRDVSASQPLNQNVEDWAFFTFDDLYYIWQFYAVAKNELLLTTLFGITAVSVIGLLFIPHWSAILFVTPFITILYVDLLGFLQLAGISINAVSYIALAMSIGLLVDFLFHILLRYYESKEFSREEKVKDTLQTIGSSVLIGGISTFLGVIPLAFSVSDIFFTIFITFLGVVTIGITHGLIFIPVVLSICGPNVVLDLSVKKEIEENHKTEDRDNSTGKNSEEDDNVNKPKESVSSNGNK